MEYLINVALSFTPQLVVGLVLWAVISAVMNRTKRFKERKNFKENRYYLVFFLAVSLAMAAISPSITYKHVTFDSARESYQIEQLNQQEHERTDLVIQDRSRPDHSVTAEEWKAKSEYEKSGDAK